MSGCAGYAGVQVQVDDLQRVKAIFPASDNSGAQAEREGV
jgi:hypothetical protein